METLREHQHEISDVYGLHGLVFGTEDTGYLTTSRPVHEGGDKRTNDRERPREDGVVFGVDYLGGKTVTFEIGAITDKIGPHDPLRANLAYLDQLEGVWNHRRWRNDPRAIAMLRSHEGGETWRAYGRPRGYSEVVGRLTELGFTQSVAQFVMTETGWYRDVESDAVVGIGAGSTGGLKAPMIAPFGLTKPSTGQGVIRVGGTRETWLTVEIHGPVSTPRVEIGDGIIVGLNGALAHDDVIVVSSAPWDRRVYRQADDAPLPGRVSGVSTPLPDLFVDPGDHAVRFTGTDATGTAYVRILWRDSRSRPGGAWPMGEYQPPPTTDPEPPTQMRAGLWTGYGPPPDMQFGAREGDEYLDLLTGNVYVLN